MKNPLLHNQVALVTGSTRGLGRSIAERFAREGAQVVINSRTQEDAEAVAQAIGPPAIGMAADVSKPEEANRLVEQIQRETGRLDILVNNAGIALDNFVTGISDERWDQVIATNPVSYTHLTLPTKA